MLNKLIGALEAAIEAAKECDRDLRLPQQEVGIGYALKQLRGILGDNAYICISPPDFNWHSADGEVSCGEWIVYDGSKHFKAKTLAEGVAHVVAAHSNTPSDTPEFVEQKLTEILDPLPL